MKREIIILLLFGVILLGIGLAAYFYVEVEEFPFGYVRKNYPYQDAGLVLILAGIVITAISLLISVTIT